MEPVFVKLIVLIVTLVLSLVFGLIPLKLIGWMKKTEARERRLSLILSFLSCFSGGIFLGVVLIHLLPEVTEDFNESMETQGIVTEYPFAFLVVCLGLFLVLFLEKIVIECKANGAQQIEPVIPAKLPGEDNTNVTSEPTHPKAFAVNASFESGSGESMSLLAQNELYANQGMSQSTARKYMTIEDKGEIETLPTVRTIVTPQSSDQICAVDMVDGLLKITGIIRSFVLLLALAFHSIFAGLAVGLQTTEAKTYALFIAIDSHKFVVAFSLGLEMAQTVGMSNLTRIFSMIAFSLMTPIGIAIGMLIVDTGDSEDPVRHLVSSVLQALATGTFLYVTFFEILQKELNTKRTYDLLRVLMILIGFSFMAGIKVLDQ